MSYIVQTLLLAVLLDCASLLARESSCTPLDYPCMVAKRCAFSERGRARWNTLDADSSHSYDMLSIRLDYRIEPSDVPMTGIATIRFVSLISSNVFKFNAEGISVTGVNENDMALPFLQAQDTVTVTRPASPGDTVTVWFVVQIPIVADNGEVGYHFAWSHAFTFNEPYGARRWIPCFDQPFDKVNEFVAAITMAESWSLASNGRLVETTIPEHGYRREVYRSEDPITTYLMMICAGDYSVRTETVDDIEYRYFAFPQDSMKAAYDWERTPQMVELFDSLISPYPFGEYGMVQASLFNGWGAMEHQTFTTYGHHLVDSMRTFEGIVAHELMHQWFGDALSPVDFRNMWLNEGFATFGHILWYEHVEGRHSRDSVLAAFADGYFQEARLHPHYTVYDPPEDFLFGAAIYFKGAWVLHMLREQIPLLGPFDFWAALGEYVNRFRFGTVDTDDFATVINEFAPQNLQWFFDQWIYSPGHPVLDIAILNDYPSAHMATIMVNQMQPEATIYRLPIRLLLQTSSGPQEMTIWVDSRMDTVVIGDGSSLINVSLAEYQPLLYQGTGANAGVPESFLPGDFDISEIYPNPFNSRAQFTLNVNSQAIVSLRVYDLMGREVATVLNDAIQPGMHELEWNASSAPSGLYFISASSPEHTLTRKALLLK